MHDWDLWHSLLFTDIDNFKQVITIIPGLGKNRFISIQSLMKYAHNYLGK